MSTSLISSLIGELTQIFRRFATRLETPDEFVGLMRELGWEWDLPYSEIPNFGLFSTHVSDVEDAIFSFIEEHDEIQKLEHLVNAINASKVINTDLNSFDTDFFAAYTSSLTIPTHLNGNLAGKLFNYLLVEYFRDYHPSFYTFFRLIGVFDLTPIEVGGVEYPNIGIDFRKLPRFLSDPRRELENLFGSASSFASQILLDLIEDTFVDLGAPAGQYLPHLNLAKHLRDLSEPISFADMGKELRLTIFEASLADAGYVEAGVSIYPIPSEYGIAIIPYLNGGVGVTLPLGAYTQLEISGDLSSGVAIKLTPDGDLAQSGLLSDTSSSLDSSVKATISSLPTDERILIFGNPEASRLDLEGVAFTSGIRISSNNPTDIYFEIHLADLQFILDIGEGDGFLQKILPDIDFRSNFDLTLGYSSSSGVYFSGSGALELVIPIHKNFGPVKLETIYLKLEIDGSEINTTIAVSAGAELGPIAISIERIGIKLPFAFPERSDWGDFGPIDFRLPCFKPPNGAGLFIDTGGITGGGYVEFDNENKRYAGILALNFGDLGLVAIGLITTRMPDGSKGFSLLLCITVEFSPPIQLSFGFTLSAVGGLIGINRAMMVDVLREGLKNKTLDSILFPKDPILNASRIISDLRAVFPPEEGRFIVGPVVRIGWGSPNIITAEVGIFIDLPGPRRIVLLGQLSATFPKPERPKLTLNIDILGVLDFTKKTFSIDATIYDSKLLFYSLSGDFALRTGWGDNPMFAVSLGGFHPDFSPPPKFPELKRLTLDLSQSSSLQLFCTTYFALTSNSLQFGARLDLLAKSGGASVEGFLEFDALIYFSPFGFIICIRGSLEAKFKGHSLAGVKLELELSGPNDWHVKGKATFSILMWDPSVSIDKRWGSKKESTLPAVDPWDFLEPALHDSSSWGSVLPPQTQMVETLRSQDEPAAPDSNTLLMHPAGSIEIRQKVLPFDMKLDKLGNSPAKDHTKFTVSTVTTCIDGVDLELTHSPVKEYFARAQYEELTDSKRLSIPSFEKMSAGVSVGTKEVLIGGDVEPTDVAYESILIQGENDMPPHCGGGIANLNVGQAKLVGNPAWSWNLVRRLTKNGAAGKALLRNSGNAKFNTFGIGPKIRVNEEGYTVVSNEDMRPIELNSGTEIVNDGTLTRMAADQALESHVESHPDAAGNVQVVSAFEVAV